MIDLLLVAEDTAGEAHGEASPAGNAPIVGLHAGSHTTVITVGGGERWGDRGVTSDVTSERY